MGRQDKATEQRVEFFVRVVESPNFSLDSGHELRKEKE